MKTCKTCEYSIYNPAVDEYVCTNSNIKHKVVGEDFGCSLWKEKE